MTLRKPLILATFFSAFLLLSFYSIPSGNDADPDAAPEVDQQQYEQEPPIVLHYWVQKLQQPLEDGRNMILRIEYEPDSTMPDSINIYYGGGRWYSTFRDNGTAPDLVSNDGIYAAYITENIPEFINRVHAYENTLNSQGHVVKFTGHLGEWRTQLPVFDEGAFDNYEAVEFDAVTINAIDCADEIKVENSLFITDKSVVEDPGRTYNPITLSGNPSGEWTFGYLMGHAAAWVYTGISPADLMKSLVKHWMVDHDGTNGNPMVNNQIVPKRIGVFKYVIYPWLKRCDPNITPQSLDENNWETVWDNIGYSNHAALLANAPFKLTAIVNRMDLRGNSAYSRSLFNAGETRFIFTLIPSVGNGVGCISGQVPYTENQDGQGGHFLDWEGMNIIFEYGNIATDQCELKDLAQQWLDLSAFSLGSDEYKDALAAITHAVTYTGAGGGAKPNHSALNRIRTNERIFRFPGQFQWDFVDWEMRQFEIDPATYLFKQVPVSNTPISSANYAYNLQSTSSVVYPYINSDGTNLINLIYGPGLFQKRILNGTHNLPATYGANTILSAVARMDGEYKHYWGMDFGTSTVNYNSANYPNANYDQTRAQLSLNTCQGCHTGETKTMFTHVAPAKYGEQIDYWSTVNPNNVFDIANYRAVDTRDYNNIGENLVNSTIQSNYSQGTSAEYFQKISAFLTGRKYTGSGVYTDDWDDPADNATDNSMNGLYYVSDPSNSVTPAGLPNFQPPTNLKWGYNDLRRRKEDLCKFLNIKCRLDVPPNTDISTIDMSVVTDIVQGTSHQTFPWGSH